MAWTVLILAGILEAVWAIALSRIKGPKKGWAIGIFAVSVSLSMAGLAWAMISLPVGTAYAVWVGIGASLTVVWSLITRQERVTVARILLLMLLIGSVMGLRAVSG